MNQAIPSFPDFGKLVPGFDFLQNLAKQAAGAQSQASPQLPNLGNWIAPTLSLEELDKRVQELKAVQFWLDQNATALKATIQALEVQKMTLATLKGMNFNMTDMANAFTIKTGESLASMKEGVASLGKSFAGLEIPPSAFQAAKAEAKTEAESSAKAAAASAQSEESSPAANGMVDPMQWWGALTQQFQTIATEAMKEVASKTALDATTAMAQEAVKTATDMAKEIAETASKSMSSGQAAMDTVLKSSMPAPAAAKPAARAASKAAAPKAAVKAPASKTAAKTPARQSAATSAKKTTR
ncbi:MAG: hypothetical protein NTZ64_04595 [Polaromonas sp.]|nr:hypothetical protein [Polaromonas sp.]